MSQKQIYFKDFVDQVKLIVNERDYKILHGYLRHDITFRTVNHHLLSDLLLDCKDVLSEEDYKKVHEHFQPPTKEDDESKKELIKKFEDMTSNNIRLSCLLNEKTKYMCPIGRNQFNKEMISQYYEGIKKFETLISESSNSELSIYEERLKDDNHKKISNYLIKITYPIIDLFTLPSDTMFNKIITYSRNHNLNIKLSNAHEEQIKQQKECMIKIQSEILINLIKNCNYDEINELNRTLSEMPK